MKTISEKWLLRRDEDPAEPQVRTAVGRRCGVLGICANALLVALKLAAGLLSGSVAAVADAVNNLSDAASALLTLLGFRLAERPADSRHPFGHARFEYLTALAVSGIIVVLGVQTGQSAIHRILQPEKSELSWLLTAVLLAGIGIKWGLYQLNDHLGTVIDSGALKAAAADSRNDCLSTGAVLLSAVLSPALGVDLDGWMGLGMAAFILISGIRLAVETISPLLGEGADPEIQREIAKELKKEEKILGFHDLMIHDYGPGQRFASVHAEMDQRETLLTSHAVLDAVEKRVLEQHRVHLTIHCDPVETDDPELNEMKREVTLVLGSIDRRIRTHHFHLRRGEKRTDLIFDVTLPDELLGQESQIRKQLTTAINLSAKIPYLPVITFESAAFNQAEIWEEE